MSIVRWPRDLATGPVDPLAVDDLDGHLLVLDGVSADDDASLSWIERAPCMVVGLAPEGKTPSSVPDVVFGAGDPGAQVDAIGAAVDANPQACRSLVDVLRIVPALDVRAGLTVESLAYSNLLAGPEFARWLASRRPVPPRPFTDEPVRTMRRGPRLEVVLHRPENRNAFSAAMRDALFEALVLAEVDDSIESIDISAEGPIFSSGGDLAEFGTAGDVVRAHQIRTQRSVGALLARLAPRVTVRVHGTCVGAGVELPAFAGRVVAHPETTFTLPEIRMGLIPGAGGTVSISRRIGRQATALLAVLGDVVDADRARALGLVDEVTTVH